MLESKAVGRVENKLHKYNGYEKNDDLDLNWYESFYRTHDPQVGRFWQIDPKPIYELEGIYNSMANNPISNIDILGDITYYYNSEGILLRSQSDGKKKATVSVVTDDNIGLFTAAAAILDIINAYSKEKKGEKAYSNSEVAGLLSKTGVSYDIKEYFDFFDRHSKDYYTFKAGSGRKEIVRPTDGKGKMVNEWGAHTNVVDGYMRIMTESENAGNPLISAPKGIHTHTIENRSGEAINDDGSGYESFTAKSGKALVDYDKGTVSTVADPRNGKFAIVVSPTHVYFYSQGLVAIAIDRKMIPSKNPGEIK